MSSSSPFRRPSTRQQIRDLSRVLAQVLKLQNELAKIGEHALTGDAVDIANKLQQKIDGHRSQLKRGKKDASHQAR